MGHYVKNREVRSSGYAVRLPYSTPLLSPECPVEGLIRYNKDNDKVEVYRNNQWRAFKVAGDEDTSPPIKDTFYGDAIETVFGPMSVSYEPGKEILILVHVQQVWQNPNVNYEVDGFYITMKSPVPDGHDLVIIHGYI